MHGIRRFKGLGGQKRRGQGGGALKGQIVCGHLLNHLTMSNLFFITYTYAHYQGRIQNLG